MKDQQAAMSTHGCFPISEKHVGHDTFDGEILAVDVDAGTYYTLTGVSANLWNCIHDGPTVGITELFKIYVPEQADIEATGSEFIEQLTRKIWSMATARPGAGEISDRRKVSS